MSIRLLYSGMGLLTLWQTIKDVSELAAFFSVEEEAKCGESVFCRGGKELFANQLE
jgi:hypothetical protein